MTRWPTALLCLLAVGPTQGADAADKVVVGYVYGPPRDLDFSLYTHLCHAFVVADADGTPRPGKDAPSRDLTGAAHKAQVRVLLSLGGWGWDRQFAEIVAHPEAEDRYVKATLGMVDAYDYDGIELDWEYPDTAAEVVGFERLTRRFRAGLDTLGKAKGRRLELTMAASSYPGTLKWLRTEFLVETMDWVNVMTYDYAGDWTAEAGHNAPLHDSTRAPGRSLERTIAYLLDERKLPADRIALGIPLYGRGFGVAEPCAPTKGAPKPKLGYTDYHRISDLTAQGWTRRRDDETKTPWLLAPDRSAVIGYDDAESVGIKARWARQKGLRGVFFWETHGDRMADGSNPLQRAARRGLLDKAD